MRRRWRRSSRAGQRRGSRISKYLGNNEIGDEGCKALAAALGKEGAAPRLEMLALNGNQIGDEGCKALAASLKDGAAPSLKARVQTPHVATCPPRQMLIAPPLAQCLLVGSEPPELKAVCAERHIKLA